VRRTTALTATACSILLGVPAAAQNLLTNPDFDADVAGWTQTGGPVTWNALDANGSASSGSARLVTPSAEGETVTAIQQCVEVTGGTDYVFSAKVFRPQGEQVSAFGPVVWYEDVACATFLEDVNVLSLFPPGTGAWQQLSATTTAPAAARSAVVRVRARREGAGALVVHYDDLVFAPDLGCVDDATTLCLNDGRFRVNVAWRTPQGQAGAGNGVRLTGDTGYFWFFNSTNVEIVLKVLDACPTAFERYWVFIAGLTNVEVEITVVDTVADEERTYFNPLDRPFEPIQDTSAFATCP
jgi:hypothetical protein